MARASGRVVQGHVARRRFGQNFLADAHYVARIADAVSPRAGETVVEIGPGLGALTAELVARAGRVVAIEIDRDLASRLRERFAPGRLTLIEGDALAFDFASLGHGLRIVGNLPYNISSPLLFHLAAQVHALADLTVMLQREVVARMTASPATADYGRLTVMLGATFSIERLFTVPAGAFRPAPKVESAVARLVPLGRARPAIADPRRFSAIVAAAFAQRRKTLRNALANVVAPAAFAAAGIDPQRRGETLSVAEFVRLADATLGQR
ncbi:MAG TPA: 16S rRNA (adenine(1518)-N(6)/adenine(1519)-N(6))-dimethyltransferase RsmA [Casimicrobiaceae bacterium]|nr:16S rRNA (adenine(1518)-N(6)/adenine(1519)-N(6))-dimethyltransferase RsmA [Casimicrobiaceae bacterium]